MKNYALFSRLGQAQNLRNFIFLSVASRVTVIRPGNAKYGTRRFLTLRMLIYLYCCVTGTLGETIRLISPLFLFYCYSQNEKGFGESNAN